MSAADYRLVLFGRMRLRIERGPDAEDYPSAEDLGRLFSEAEEIIGEGLPEGWYCKIEETPESETRDGS